MRVVAPTKVIQVELGRSLTPPTSRRGLRRTPARVECRSSSPSSSTDDSRRWGRCDESGGLRSRSAAVRSRERQAACAGTACGVVSRSRDAPLCR
jgi:hypothetical protein